MRKYAIIVALLSVSLFLGLLNTADGAPTDLLTLTERNLVTLNMPIMGAATRNVQVGLIERASKLKAGEPIYLFLNSPGGSIEDGLQIIETAKGLPNPVHTISQFSASMSFVISQYLGTRYLLSNATLMAHRARVGGVDGEVPGSAYTRLDAVLEMTNRLDGVVAARAGLNVGMYQAMVRDEMWLSADQGIRQHFGDKIVKVRCDKTLSGVNLQSVQVGPFSFQVGFSKCPLISYPVSIQMGNRVNTAQEIKAQADALDTLKEYLLNKRGFINNYSYGAILGE